MVRSLKIYCLDKQCCARLKEEKLLEDEGSDGRIFEAGTGWVPNPDSWLKKEEEARGGRGEEGGRWRGGGGGGGDFTSLCLNEERGTNLAHAFAFFFFSRNLFSLRFPGVLYFIPGLLTLIVDLSANWWRSTNVPNVNLSCIVASVMPLSISINQLFFTFSEKPWMRMIMVV